MRVTLLPILLLLGAIPTSTLADPLPEALAESACEAALEVCFRKALAVRDGGSPEERSRLILDRLQYLQMRAPDSIWSKRAALASALVLRETRPAEALHRLDAVRSDFPILDDYIRLWIGETLYKAGETSKAAEQFQRIPAEVPDTLLAARSAFLSGEAWYRAGQCGNAIDPLSRSVALAPLDPAAPTAYYLLADCLLREGRHAESEAAFRYLWVRYPNAPEAREAQGRLSLGLNGQPWRPTPEDLYARAAAFQTLALHAEAVEELQRFLSAAPQHPKRDEAKFKLALSLVRLKRYDQAREMYRALLGTPAPQGGEAAVWLARVFLRQDQGDRLLSLLSSLPSIPVTVDQKATITLLAGVWLDDQGQVEKAITKYRQAMATAEASGLRLEALWRIGWAHYRAARYQEAAASFQAIMLLPDDALWTPQALYWLGRARDRLQEPSEEAYTTLCRRYHFSYYCQLAERGGKVTASVTVGYVGEAPSNGLEPAGGLRNDSRYLKATELALLGFRQEAAKELDALSERYAKDRSMIMELCGILAEAGQHHQALRLARVHFRDPIERGNGEPVPRVLWSVAYPTAHLPIIRGYAGSVDPLLAAAIIREESQYDPRALSRVGAIGLMQLMPGTAQTLAKKAGTAELTREDLFDQETNIKLGVRYLEQLLQEFSSNIAYAVAAYNAGPQAVSSWIQKYAGMEQDEFIEMIPYQETRAYVKRVLRSYREYARLTPPACNVPSLDKAC
ncbi:lytic transglycosylase domain-containing protein [Candidatus Nitrospira bockiana]